MRRRAVALAALGLLAAALAWGVTDRLEQRNDFCNACHLRPGVPLHAEVRRDFDAARPASLAGAHAGSAVAERGSGPEAAFRCIDCHGGTGALGRLRVKALAGRDAFWYVVGRFEEPEGMRWPLWDEDCRKCHASFAEAAGEGWRDPRFHELGVHNADLGVGCVECHLVHEPGGDPEADFLHAARVRSQCARCHSEFEEGA
jgi:hypothetical protein